MIDIKVPTVGESINEVTLVKWLKQDGDYVSRDEVIAELESEKATFEVNAEKAGVLKTVGKEGDTLNIGDTLAQIDETAAKPEGAAAQAEAPATPKAEEKPQAQPAPSAASVTSVPNDVKATPVASAIIADKGVDPKSIQASGYGGKIL
ncbi:MAG: 2-oxoglutarate dehydrogenase, partial [Flaviaesturariibacter sp.]|nr:2-oxoglutarate dehydrogenase [Flaviaesturariibacter sp.]